MLPGGGFVVLDTQVTLDLELEGTARDLIRAVQQARREAGLDVSDRITLTIAAGEHTWRAALEHRDLIIGETLADQFSVSMNLDDLTVGDDVSETLVGNEQRVRIRVAKR